MPRPAAIALLALPILGILAFVVFVLAPAVGHQLSQFISNVPGYVDAVEGWVEGVRAWLVGLQIEGLNERTIPRLRDVDTQAVVDYLRERRARLTEGGLSAVLGIGRGVGTVLTVLGYLVLLPILTYYLLRDWDRIRERISDADRKRRFVRGLFGRIAGRYDLTNDVMSFGLHRRWKRRLMEMADLSPEHRVLDLAAGTGDLALRAVERTGRGLVAAADLTPEMMEVGRERPRAGDVAWIGADALELPFADRSFDRVLIGYGLRNFPDLGRSLQEIHRCLVPGGRLLSLDFAKPPIRWLRRAYLGYLDVSTAAVGWLLHRDPEAYLYIPESLRAYPSQDEVCGAMETVGFGPCGWVDLVFGTMAIHFAHRPA